MSGFDADWLALREPADHAALDDALAAPMAALAGSRPCLRVVDLGCGTGSGLRWLSPRLPARQRWICLDDDRALLARLPHEVAAWGRRTGASVHRNGHSLRLLTADGEERLVTARRVDIARGALGACLNGADLVCAFALADLVSAAWMTRLVATCDRHRCAVLLALDYDGRIALEPAHEHDRTLSDLVNAHQRGDKGFGPALGPAATGFAHGLLAERRYALHATTSDWRLDATGHQRLLRALLAGWVTAALEAAPETAGPLGAWLQRRLSDLADGKLAVTVGHRDLLALPA